MPSEYFGNTDEIIMGAKNIIAIAITIFPVWLYTNQNTPLINAPAIHPRMNLIDAYYHGTEPCAQEHVVMPMPPRREYPKFIPRIKCYRKN